MLVYQYPSQPRAFLMPILAQRGGVLYTGAPHPGAQAAIITHYTHHSRGILTAPCYTARGNGLRE